MTIRQLASVIAKREGKRSQARIGDIREILGILADILFQDYVKNGEMLIGWDFIHDGEKRAKKKARKKK